MELQDLIRRAVAIGRRTGFITFDQLNELLPGNETGPEDIEAVMQALSAEEIQVTDK
jgi:RNA polymerase primary sigma factor